MLIVSILISISAKAQEQDILTHLTDTTVYIEKTHWKYGIELSLSNNYVWKGIEMYAGATTCPALTAQYGNLTIQTRSHLPLSRSINPAYHPDINLMISYEKQVMKGFSVTPQMTSFFYPSNYNNVFTTLVSTKAKYELEPVGIMINPMVDVCGNVGAFYIEYGMYKEIRVNHQLTLDSRFLMGWGNASFTDYFIKAPSKKEYITRPKEIAPQTLRNARFELCATYNVSDRVILKPEFNVFSNFMRSYTNPGKNISANGALTLAYRFSK